MTQVQVTSASLYFVQLSLNRRPHGPHGPTHTHRIAESSVVRLCTLACFATWLCFCGVDMGPGRAQRAPGCPPNNIANPQTVFRLGSDSIWFYAAPSFFDIGRAIIVCKRHCVVVCDSAFPRSPVAWPLRRPVRPLRSHRREHAPSAVGASGSEPGSAYHLDRGQGNKHQQLLKTAGMQASVVSCWLKEPRCPQCLEFDNVGWVRADLRCHCFPPRFVSICSMAPPSHDARCQGHLGPPFPG